MSNEIERVNVVVCGAHMSGLPLNGQLVELDGELVSRTSTAPGYRLYHLADFDPPRPGMVRVTAGGVAIEVEVWSLPVDNFGRFVAVVLAPLCIGTVALADGTAVHGFLCESYAVGGAEDISECGGWRRFLQSISNA